MPRRKGPEEKPNVQSDEKRIFENGRLGSGFGGDIVGIAGLYRGKRSG